MKELFSVGDCIYGFCGGFFGDDYTDKICVMVTDKYAVFQYTSGFEEGFGTVLNLGGGGITKEMVADWKNKNEQH